jgi:pyrimidine nucleoside transport protein
VIWRHVMWGMTLQLIFGLIVLRWDFGRRVFECLGQKVTTFLDYTNAGSSFVYGYLVTDQNTSGIALGTVFAFKVSYLICIISQLYYKSRSATTVFHWQLIFWVIFFSNRFCRSSSFSVSLSTFSITTEWCNGLFRNLDGSCKSRSVRRPPNRWTQPPTSF